MTTETFTLTRPTHRDRHIKPKFQSQCNTKQMVLFPGADCLPGQMDLPLEEPAAEPSPQQIDAAFDALFERQSQEWHEALEMAAILGHRGPPMVAATEADAALLERVRRFDPPVGQTVRFKGNADYPPRVGTIARQFKGRTGTVFYVFTENAADGGVFTADELEMWHG